MYRLQSITSASRRPRACGDPPGRAAGASTPDAPTPTKVRNTRHGRINIHPIVRPKYEDRDTRTRRMKGAGSVTENANRAAWLQQARSYLRKADPVLAWLIDDRPAFDPRAWMAQLPPMDLYGALLFQVTGQQLSVAATRRTLARIEILFDGHLPSPAQLLGIDPGKLREAGLSWRKIRTLRDLAGRLSDGRLNPNALSSLPDDELMAELTAIPGIGPWTVQGAMIIALQREDVVLPGDLALRKAIQVAYQLDHLPTQQEVLAIAEKWRPYRSLAYQLPVLRCLRANRGTAGRPARDVAPYPPSWLTLLQGVGAAPLMP